MANPPAPIVNPQTMIFMLILWATLTTIFVILLLKGNLNRIPRITLWITSTILGGVLLGGVPNAVLPISQIFLAIGTGTFAATLVQQIIVLVFLLGTTLLIGRVFCGIACPLGAAQELLSTWRFKSKVIPKEKAGRKIDISPKIATIIRWIFFALFAVLAIAWSFSIVDILNPFIGYKVFANPWVPVFLIPMIALIVVLLSSLFIYRPWCRLFCPFGALASLTARFSRVKLQRTDKCTDCQLCEKVCPTDEATRDASKGECYLCNRCIEICPQGAITFGFKHDVRTDSPKP